MVDIATIWDVANGRGDWQIAPAIGDLVKDQDLQTAVLISLFTDAEAGTDDVIPDGTGDPRGWWGGPIGSKLWLLDRAKQLASVPVLAKTYISDALAWLISDGVISTIDIVTEWTKPGVLGASIILSKAGGSKEDDMTVTISRDFATPSYLLTINGTMLQIDSQIVAVSGQIPNA